MSSTDKALGLRVHERLKELKLETPAHFAFTNSSLRDNENNIELQFKHILGELSMDLTDDSIEETPRRLAKMFAREIFYGLSYDNFPKCTVIDNKMRYENMVLSKNILVRSVCEHHFVPFIGRAHVAYIPGAKVIGLSKLNRVVDFFSRRPQVQERLTEQVAHALALILETDNIAVMLDCEHFCVKLRGVEDPHSSTITSKVLGKFMSVEALRNEYLHLATKEC